MEVMEKHLRAVLNHSSEDIDSAALNDIQQRPVCTDISGPPTEAELTKAVNAAQRRKAAGKNGIVAEYLKAICHDPTMAKVLHDVVVAYWTGQEKYPQFQTGKLLLLPKKGDLSDPNKWRGITLLDVTAKIVCAILVQRLTVVMEAVSIEEQNGFRPQRGCTDASFSLRLALAKRQEHNLDTWAVYIDLVKAFDRVPRQLLWAAMRKFGVPEDIVNVVQRQYEGVTVEMDIEGNKTEIPATVGVKQGDNLAPLLFLFAMQAALETLQPKWPLSDVPEFAYMADVKSGANKGRVRGQLMGQNAKAKGTSFRFFRSLYADDSAFLFTTWEGALRGMNILVPHFAKFGMEVHLGWNGKASKTEATYYPARRDQPLTPQHTQPLVLDNGGVIPFVNKFCYLGNIISADLTDTADISRRIMVAAKAFNDLSCVLNSNTFTYKAKKLMYLAIPLNALLWGCEFWAITAEARQRLTSFHNRCVRTMLSVTPSWQRRRRLSTKVLNHWLDDIKPIDYYIRQRRLQWAGKIANMPATRLPRRMMAAWVRNPRPRGRPYKTYGQTLTNDIRAAVELAHNKHPQLNIQPLPKDYNGHLSSWFHLVTDADGTVWDAILDYDEDKLQRKRSARCTRRSTLHNRT